MRKIIVRNADGTTKLIQKKVLATGSSAQTPSSETKSAPQKVQVIRRPDGTLQYQGLKPGKLSSCQLCQLCQLCQSLLRTAIYKIEFSPNF